MNDIKVTAQPAAPEPSAEPLPELAMTAQERMSWGAHQSCFAQIGSWKVRAEFAKAQLAAVRDAVQEVIRDNNNRDEDALDLAERLDVLLTAPSHGAGARK